MATPRIKKFRHNVGIQTLSDRSLMVSWDGYKGRHDYLMAQNLEDLDILVTEILQALHNYKRKVLIYKH